MKPCSPGNTRSFSSGGNYVRPPHSFRRFHRLACSHRRIRPRRCRLRPVGRVERSLHRRHDVLRAGLAGGLPVKGLPARPTPRPDGDFVADDLARDLRTADVLLHQKDASDAMWRHYGIDSTAYLGTGYSVPLAGDGAKNYEFATQREYFVAQPLRRGRRRRDRCGRPLLRRAPGIWTFRLTAQDLTGWADKPIAASCAPIGRNAGQAVRAALSSGCRRAASQSAADAAAFRRPAACLLPGHVRAAPTRCASSSPITNRRAPKRCAPP